MRRTASSNMDKLPMVGVMEANDKRNSLDISRFSSMYVLYSYVLYVIKISAIQGSWE